MKKPYRIESTPRKVKCPVCNAITGYDQGKQPVQAASRYPLASNPGELTQCSRCLTLLEYRGQSGSLTLHVAPRRRVELFNALVSERPRKLNTPELIEYVRKYRQMPISRPAR